MDANPFADLIPSQAPSSATNLTPSLAGTTNQVSSSSANPFADLIPGSTNPRANIPTFKDFLPDAMTDPDYTTKALTGAGSGFIKVGEGLKGAYLQAKEGLGYAPEGTYKNYQKSVDAEHAFYDKTPIGQSTTSKAFDIGAQVAPYMLPAGQALGAARAGIKGIEAGAEILPTLAGSFAKNAANSAAISSLQYVPENGSRLENTMVGVGLGSAIPLVGGAVIKGINSAYQNFINPAAKQIIDLGKKWGVRVFASDADPTAANKAIAQGLEELPVGMRGQRQAQMQEAQGAAQQATDQARNNMLNVDFGGATGMAKLQQVANGSGIRAKAASGLLDDINNAGDDWQKIMQASGNMKLFRAKLIADQKYGKLSALADSYGNVNPSNALSAIDRGITDAQSGVLPDNQLIGQLQTIKDNLTSKNLNYSQMRQARSDIGDLISGYYSGGNALIPKKGIGALQGIKNGLGSDMDAFAQSNGPELNTAWKNADNFYQQAVAPYKDKQLAQALANADPDTIYSKFITRGPIEGGQGTGRAQRFYNALDDKGKAAVRYGMVNNAFQNAVDVNSKTFSPATFASQLENVASSKGVFFRGDDGGEVNGLVKLMRSVQRAPVAVSKPETGVKSIPWIAGAALAGHAISLPTALTMGGTGLGLRMLMTHPMGRNYLLAASKLKLGSPALQGIADKVGTFIQRGVPIGAIGSANNDLVQNQGDQ